MTSSLPFGQRRGGDWGGLVLLGNAPSNWPQGMGSIEGLPPEDYTTYGGDDPTHNCGTLAYIRLEFAGAELCPNNEINAFTWGGCGSDTTAHHLASKYGLDDSFEWFSSTNDTSYLVSAYPRDDHFDSQIGWNGKVQFFVGVGNLDNTNRGVELDNNENDFGALPVTAPTFFNGTFVGVGNSYEGGVDEDEVAGLYIRRGAGGSYNNILLYNWVDSAVNINGDATEARLGTDLHFNGIMMWMNGGASGVTNDLSGQVTERGQTYFATAPNIFVANPMLKNPMEYSDPDFRPLLGSPVFNANWVLPADDGFFDQSARYNGAFGDKNWMEEWVDTIQEQDMAP